MAGRAVMTTITLMALFMMMACSAAMPNTPISSRGKPELGAAQADHAAQDTDDRAREEGQQEGLLSWEL